MLDFKCMRDKHAQLHNVWLELKKNNKNALIVLLINNTTMNLQGPLVKQITQKSYTM